MGTLGKIRNRSGLLLTVIGFAMLAFILGDFMQSTRSSGSGTLYVGELLGEQILIQTFEKTVDQGIENWKTQNPNQIVNQSVISSVRNQAWAQLTRELIMDDEYIKLGIGISDDEWMERISGLNVHPEVSKIPAFQDPNNGRFDRTKVLAYLQQVEQDETGASVNNWLSFQDYLINVIRNEKYDKLVEKGVYINSEESKISYNEGTQITTYNYISLPYSMIEDSLVELSDKEIKNYYNKNKNDYSQEKSKNIDYVVFNVVPTKGDDLETRASLNDLKSDFVNYDDYLTLVRRNSDNARAVFNFNKKEDFVQDSAFSLLVDNNVGTVIGPYKSNPSTYRISKLVDVQMRPDSVQARHILISPSQEITIDSAKSIIFDLKRQVENGKDFGSLAQSRSDDKNSAIMGGELGWFVEGAMLEQFNEACFTSLINELKVVETQYGIHLIQVMNKSRSNKKFKIAYIDRNISASTETYNNYYTQAAQFVSSVNSDNDSFDTISMNENLVKRSDVKVVTSKENIIGLPNSRSIVKWMNKASLGDISEVFEFDNSYVVAKITKENNSEYIPLSEVENKVKQSLRSEKKYKKLVKRLGDYSSLEEISETMNINIVRDKKAQMSLLSVDDLGYAPELIGTIYATEIGAVSDPIKLNNFLSVVSVVSQDAYRSEGDFTAERNSLLEKIKNYTTTTSFKALETDADVLDNRSEVY
jgi:peptidyl-prolyl cis-trans isomerase D|tara:strand:+ start:3026 stop:5131 length:2106 start_codon:yes stop_codon:yes gene_type:complete